MQVPADGTVGGWCVSHTPFFIFFMSSKKNERDERIYGLIDELRLDERCSFGRDEIFRRLIKANVLLNIAYVLADATHSALLDVEGELRLIGAGLQKEDKYNYKQMMNHLSMAKKWAQKSVAPVYATPDDVNFGCDSDWWYNMIKLIEDRTGEDQRKTHMLLEFLLGMPSELGVFEKIDYSSFARE